MRFRLAILALLTVAFSAGRSAAPLAQEPSAGAVSLAELAGTVAIVGPAGRPAQQAGSVVWIPGLAAAGATSPTPPKMASRDKRFDPHVLTVPRGGTVTFPNADAIYHNVFSLSPGNSFDLGLYRKGAARSVAFHNAGLVRVYCNIHPQMTAYVFVVEGSAFVVTGADGAYRVAGIPPGSHTVRAWSEIGGETSAVLAFAPGRTTTWDLSLDGTRYRPLSHKNKHGQDYPPATRDVDRY